MFVNPEISRAKFEREVAQFRGHAVTHHSRGIWLIDATFPNVFAVLMAVKTRPFPTAAFGLLINFENYDVEPPSVRFVHPLTREPLKKRELPHLLARLQLAHGPDGQVTSANAQQLVQGWDPEGTPFVCLQGVREYHDHPGHSGDSWWLYRKKGLGTLHAILDQLATYAVDPIQGLGVQLQAQVTGFLIAQPPQ